MSFIGDYSMRQPELPPLKATHVMEFWTASNGVFARARREGVEAVIPIKPGSIPINGLFPLATKFELDYPPVPKTLVGELLAQSFKARDLETTNLIEVLFHLRWSNNTWNWTKPDQNQTHTSVTPATLYDTSLSVPLIELHSHHIMEPFFSSTDTRDEKGFRIYAVWGLLDSCPTILVRLGIYGYFAPIPASQVFELPFFVRDGFDNLTYTTNEGWLL